MEVNLAKNSCIVIERRIMRDCIVIISTYGLVKFRKRYRMRRDLFVCIVDVVTKFDPWFV